jgi:tetratricopeptide (TPR) repeat protein
MQVNYNQSMRLAGVLLLTIVSMVVEPQILTQKSFQGTNYRTQHADNEVKADGTQFWVNAPQWMSDLQSLLNLPVKQPILEQVIISEIQNVENVGDFANTLELLKVGSVLYPRDAIFAYRLGMIMAVFQPDQSQQYLALAQDEDPTLSDSTNLVIQFLETNPGKTALEAVHLGQVMGHVNEWKLAETLFTRAVAANPQLADAWALLGQTRVMLGGDGFNQFSKALSLNPNSPVGLALMSMYWKNHQRSDLALDYMRLLNALEPDQVSWVFELGNLEAQDQDLETAFMSFVRATVMAPKDPSSWQNLALFCFNYSVHLEDAGLPAVRTLMELSPDDPLSLTLMGEGLFKQGDADTAERFLLRAIQKEPTFSSAHYFLGFMYITQHNKSLAFPELVEVIELDGERGYGPLARRLLEENFGNGK